MVFLGEFYGRYYSYSQSSGVDLSQCEQKGCVSGSQIDFICKYKCPKKVKVIVNKVVVFDSCKRESFAGMYDLQSYFSFSESKHQNKFSISFASPMEKPLIQVYAGKLCKTRKKIYEKVNIKTIRSEINLSECGHPPCVQYRLEEPIKI